VLPLDKHRVFVIDEKLVNKFHTELNPETLSKGVLKEILKRLVKLTARFKRKSRIRYQYKMGSP